LPCFSAQGLALFGGLIYFSNTPELFGAKGGWQNETQTILESNTGDRAATLWALSRGR
jgi:hypothetical protein